MRPAFLQGILHVSLIFILFIGLLGFIGWFFPLHPPQLNARRSACQSNLKQIGLALQQYAQDYDEQLPSRHWKAPLFPYMKDESRFQCPGPETSFTKGTNDYFFNARFVGKSLEKIGSPKTLILTGDGRDNAAEDATLFSLPAAWRTDQKSPLRRHLDGANYGFADGHVKWMKANKVSRDMVVKP